MLIKHRMFLLQVIRFIYVTLVTITHCEFQFTFKNLDSNDLFIRLQDLTKEYNEISRLYKIGESTEGLVLVVVEITSNIRASRMNVSTLKPNVKLIGNIHGHSSGGRQILLNTVEYLLQSYRQVGAKTALARELVQTTRIHIICSMNPDGHAARSDLESVYSVKNNAMIGHSNKNKVDLNLDFKLNGRIKQHETMAVINWMNTYPFVLSACFFSDGLVVSYPYYDGVKGNNFLTADDKIFRKISKAYADAHPILRNISGNVSCDSEDRSFFKNGIVNGGDWNPSSGTMADYNYDQKNCLEISVHLGCKRWIKEKDMENLFRENIISIQKLISQAHMGIKGFIMSNDSSPISNAHFRINGIDKIFFSWKTGEFWKLLLPGTYEMLVSANSHYDDTITVNVIEKHVSVVNITLQPHNNSERSASFIHPLMLAAITVFMIYHHNL